MKVCKVPHGCHHLAKAHLLPLSFLFHFTFLHTVDKDN